MGYNGYRNYETFTVSVELANNRGLEGLEEARRVLRDLIASHEFRFEAIHAFRDWFAESEGLPDGEGGKVIGTIVSAFLEEVDWGEVARDVLGEDEPEVAA
jgi:hypothetical protein